jgi:uncharacterized protein (TIGR00369 family)
MVSSRRNILDDGRTQAILDRIRRIPIVETLRLDMREWGKGWCKAVVPRQHAYDGVFESFHGGLLMTVADSVACFAVMTLTGPDRPMTTTDMNIRFLAACLTDVTAVAKVMKLGRTLAPVTVDLFDADNTQVAVAQVTYMLLDRPPDRASPHTKGG